jgi:hypothetical protein
VKSSADSSLNTRFAAFTNRLSNAFSTARLHELQDNSPEIHSNAKPLWRQPQILPKNDLLQRRLSFLDVDGQPVREGALKGFSMIGRMEASPGIEPGCKDFAVAF